MDEEMELDVKPPPPQVAIAGDLQLQLAEAQRSFARLEAGMAQTCGVYGEIIAAIDLAAAHVRELRRLRAEGLAGAELAEAVRKVELVYRVLSAAVRLVMATRSRVVEKMCRNRMLGSGGATADAADALADVLQRIHIDLSS